MADGSIAKSNLITYLAELEHEADRRRGAAAYAATGKGPRSLPMLSYGINLGGTVGQAQITRAGQPTQPGGAALTGDHDSGAAILKAYIEQNAVLALSTQGTGGEQTFQLWEAKAIDTQCVKTFGVGTGTCCPYWAVGATCPLTGLPSHKAKHHLANRLQGDALKRCRDNMSAGLKSVQAKRPKKI